MYLERKLKTIERIIINNADLCTYSGPVPQREIIKAEKDLGIQFPVSYLWFLMTFGHGFFADDEIFGMDPVYDPHCQFGIPYVVSTTQLLRERFKIPLEYFAVSGDGYGYYYLAATSSGERSQDADLYLLDVNTAEVALLLNEKEQAVQLSDFFEAAFEDSSS